VLTIWELLNLLRLEDLIAHLPAFLLESRAIALHHPKGDKSGQSILQSIRDVGTPLQAASASIVYLYKRICRLGTLYHQIDPDHRVKAPRTSVRGFVFAHENGYTYGVKLKPHAKRKLIELTALFVVDVLFFSLVNPVQAHAAVVIVGFLLLVVTLYVLIDFLLAVGERVIPFSHHTKRRIALATTLVAALLIAMQSIGQLTVKDVLAVIPLIIVLSVYFSYMLKKQAK
jgi:hypothetical protein